MKLFKNYLLGCNTCIRQVEEAVDLGAFLSSDEKLDYYFKCLSLYGSSLKKFILEPEYKQAWFYSRVMRELAKFSVRGYTNEEIIHSLRKINRLSFLCFGWCLDAIEGYDKNGKLHIEIFNFKGDDYELKIRKFKDLAKEFAFVADMLVELGCKKASNYAKNYLSRVISDVLENRQPVPYTNLSETLMLSNLLSKNSNINRILVDFDFRGGNANGQRNGRDIREQRFVAGV